jgi:hypothetical protein
MISRSISDDSASLLRRLTFVWYPNQCSILSVNVISTTIPATLSALRHAGELAHELGIQIRLLVPQIVPYPLPINNPPVDPNFRVRQFHTVAAGGNVETYIDVRLCRNLDDALVGALLPQSLVLIGGRKRWWPTREQRLARSLSLAGHHVLFVPQN